MGKAVIVFMMKLNKTNEDMNVTITDLRQEIQTLQIDVFKKVSVSFGRKYKINILNQWFNFFFASIILYVREE